MKLPFYPSPSPLSPQIPLKRPNKLSNRKKKKEVVVSVGQRSTPPPPSMATSSSSSPTIRFLSIPPKSPDLNDFEFNESDVIFSSSFSDEVPLPCSPPVNRSSSSGIFSALSDDQHPFVRRKPAAARAVAVRKTPEIIGTNYHQSAPVNVPVWPKNKRMNYLSQFDDDDDDVADEDDEVKDGEIVPPHEIVARSYVTFSVFEGAGRTLKGRDLCRVRNAVFQKTGFLD